MRSTDNDVSKEVATTLDRRSRSVTIPISLKLHVAVPEFDGGHDNYNILPDCFRKDDSSSHGACSDCTCITEYENLDLVLGTNTINVKKSLPESMVHNNTCNFPIYIPVYHHNFL